MLDNELGGTPATRKAHQLRAAGSPWSIETTNLNSRHWRALRQLASTSVSKGELPHVPESVFAYRSTTTSIVIPPTTAPLTNNYTDVVRSPLPVEREEAVRRELKSSQDHEVADPVPASSVPADTSVISACWVYKVKLIGEFKATLLVKGWGQQHGNDCGGTCAPVYRIGNQRFLLTIAADRNWDVIHMAATKRALSYLSASINVQPKHDAGNINPFGSPVLIYAS